MALTESTQIKFCGSGSGYSPPSETADVTKNKDANGFITYEKTRQKSLYKKQQKIKPLPLHCPQHFFGLAGKDDF
jgi:hypothetical protein